MFNVPQRGIIRGRTTLLTGLAANIKCNSNRQRKKTRLVWVHDFCKVYSYFQGILYTEKRVVRLTEIFKYLGGWK